MTATAPLPTTAPTLTDGTVTLRAHRPSDVDEIVVQGQDPRMQRWTTVPVPYERQHAEAFALETMPQGWQTLTGTKGFAIEALHEGQARFAGTLDFRPDGSSGAEVGFGLAPWARGRGLMTAALTLALDWAFEALELDVVLWRADVGNWASRRVAWACGFRFEGEVRSLLAARGVRHDGWVGSLLREDPRVPGKPWVVAPVIDGESVRLRPWRDEDESAVVELCSDPQSQRWLPHLARTFGPTQAQAFLLGERTRLADGSALGLCVADRASDRCVGAVVVFGLERDGNDAELGYSLHPAERGRGLMKEAVRLVVRHAFVPAQDGGLGLARLCARVATGNTGSLRVAESVGFREIGVQRQVDPQPDGSCDDLMTFDLLADEMSLP